MIQNYVQDFWIVLVFFWMFTRGFLHMGAPRSICMYTVRTAVCLYIPFTSGNAVNSYSSNCVEFGWKTLSKLNNLFYSWIRHWITMITIMDNEYTYSQSHTCIIWEFKYKLTARRLFFGIERSNTTRYFNTSTISSHYYSTKLVEEERSAVALFTFQLVPYSNVTWSFEFLRKEIQDKLFSHQWI